MMKLRIRKHEVGLWFRHGDFKGLLAPGARWLPRRFTGADRVTIVDRLAGKFTHELLDVILDDPGAASHLHRLELADDERALVWKDGRLAWMLGTGRHAFWKAPAKIEVEVRNINDFAFDHAKVDAIVDFPGASKWLDGMTVEPGEVVLLYRNGELEKELNAGQHIFWRGAGRIERKIVDLREQSADVAGQEIMTADKVTLRVNLLVTFRVTDARLAVESVSDYAQSLYREAQLALRESVGVRTLDKLLADKDVVSNEVANTVAKRAAEFGVAIKSVGLRDVILPGDMKAILNEVILAQKQAEANLIRRREETAAARSQVNTAKLLADNPALTRMKELEALQEILKGTKATFLFGSGELLGQVRSLTGDGGDASCFMKQFEEQSGGEK